MQSAINASLMRGGTSKGLYFLAEDIPNNIELRDKILLAIMGSPDMRQIDGIGGAHPLTSKVAIISRSKRGDADVDYLFLQIQVDRAEVSDAQNCGNILAGVGPFAIENGLVDAKEGFTDVRIHMVNTGTLARSRVQTPNCKVEYHGNARIDGVQGTHAPIMIDFLDVAGSSCGALLPSGNKIDEIEGYKVTLIDNGMPVILINALDLGVSGYETPIELEQNQKLRAIIETIRIKAGLLMNLGDVTKKSVPKITLISPPQNKGDISTRTFIPHRCHDAIGVLGAVSVATACAIKGTIAYQSSNFASEKTFEIEHPTGFFSVQMEIDNNEDEIKITKSALLRTARLLMRGQVFFDTNLLEAKNNDN